MIVAFIDGGARGNPGPAGYGVHVVDPEGTVMAELYGGLGVATNNVAEYNGLLAALQWAIDNGHSELHIKADSELLVMRSQSFDVLLPLVGCCGTARGRARERGVEVIVRRLQRRH